MNGKTQNQPLQETTAHLRIMQINLNKSPNLHHKLINGNLHTDWDIILIQEPHMNYYKHIKTTKGFRQVYPNNKVRNKKTIHSGIWMNKMISTNLWHALEIEDSADVTAVQLKGKYSQITIFNIYNNCGNNNSLMTLDNYLNNNYTKIHGKGKYVIWAGDFSWHHPD